MSYQFGRPSRFAELSDPSGPVAQREWQEFLRRREELLEQILGRIGMRQQVIAEAPIMPEELTTEQSDLLNRSIERTEILAPSISFQAKKRAAERNSGASVGPTLVNPADAVDRFVNESAVSNQFRKQYGTSEYNDLLGQAEFYGISNADTIPPQQLEALIERRRSGVLNERINAGEFDKGAGERAVDAVQTALGTIFVGSTQALVDMSQRIPFIGDVMARTETIRQADQWLSKVGEGYSSGLIEDEEAGWRIAHGLSGMLGYALPAAANYQFVSRMLTSVPAVARLSPILRGALAGGADAWMLEGGGDAPLTARGVNVALGTALGGAAEAGGVLAGSAVGALFGGVVGGAASDDIRGALIGGAAGAATGGIAASVLPRLFARAQRSFHSEVGGSSRPSGPVIEGEWRFEEDLMLESGQRLLSPPREPTSVVRLDQIPEPPPVPTRPEPIGVPFPPASGSSPLERGLQLSRGQDIPQLGTAQRNELDQLRAQINEVIEQRNVARRQAEQHPLTGLPNRRAFDLARASADADPNVGYVVMDARGFKRVNDELGHTRGDEALQNFALALNRTAQDLQVPARIFHFGGDEFAAIVPQEMLSEFATRAQRVSKQVFYAPEAMRQEGFNSEDVRSQFDGISTELDAFVGQTFDEADQGLMRFKNSTRSREESLTVPAAQGEAIALTKQASIMESPALAELANKPSFDDYDVARALVASNPGQASVVKGVTPEILARISPDTPLSEANFRFVPRRPEYDPSITNIETGRPQGWMPETDELTPLIEQYKAGIYRQAMMGDPEAVESRKFLEESKVRRERELVGYIPYPDRVDALINATDRQAAQYARYGMFEGQKVTTANGKEGIVTGFSGENVLLRSPMNKGLKYKAKMANVLPSRSSGQMLEASGEYQTFANEALTKLNSEAEGAGIGPFDWLSNEMASQLPRYMDEFFESRSFDPATRGMLEEYFNYQRVQGFKQLAPEEFALADRLMSEASDLVNMRAESQHDLPVSVEELAAAKGFELIVSEPDNTIRFPVERTTGGPLERLFAASEGWDIGPNDMAAPTDLDLLAREFYEHVTGDNIRPGLEEQLDRLPEDQQEAVRAKAHDLLRRYSIWGIPAEPEGPIGLSPTKDVASGFGVLRDKLSSLQVPVADEDAARSFLQNFDRELPDETPISSVPAELFDVVPGGSAPTDGPEPGWIDTEHHTEWAEKAADSMERELDYINLNNARRLSGGGGGGTGLPPTGSFAMLPPPPPPPPPGQQFRRADPRRLYQAMARMDSLWLRFMEPMRNWFITAEQELRGAGISNELWKQYANVSTGVTRAHNEMNPYLSEWADIVGRFRHRIQRDGTVVKVEQLANWNDKLAAMQKAGYTREEIEAQQMIRPFFDRLWGVARESAPIGYLFDYLPALRNLQARGSQTVDPFGQWERNHLPHEWKWFARYPRAHGTQARHMSIADLGTLYIRGLFFERNVAPAWNEMKKDWADPAIPEQIAVPVNGWLDLVLTGVGAQKDVMISGTRQLMNKFGVPVVDADVRAMFGGTLGTMYRAGLGLSPHVVFRDAIQPWFTGTEIGMKWVAQAYKGWLDPAEREAMWERALRGGWVQKGQAQVATSEVFSQQLITAGGDPLLPDALADRRESIAQVLDRLYDMTPRGLKQGIQGTTLDPLLAYTRLGELNRLIAGDAGYKKAQAALNSNLTFSEDILREAGLHIYDEPIVRQARALLRAGNHEEFLNLAANEAANSQFRYGTVEAPVGIQQLGSTGRAIMMYGTFTTQYIARMRRNLSNLGREGARSSAAAFLGRQTAIWAAITAAAAATGWKRLERWKWHRSLTFAGGPPAIGAIQTGMAGLGVVAGALGERPSPEQTSAMAQFGMRGMDAFFPYAGGMRTLQGLAMAVEGVDPGNVAMRGLMTGEWGTGRSFKSMFDDPEFIERWQYGPPPPPYPDINSLLNDRQRVQGLTNNGVVFDTRPAFPESLPPIPEAPGGQGLGGGSRY